MTSLSPSPLPSAPPPAACPGPFVRRARHQVTALAALILLLPACGCRTRTPFQPPAFPAPAAWRTPSAPGTAPDLAWWEFYRDPTLVRLVRTALDQNQDLLIAAARIEEAQAGYRSRRSALFPEANASAGWTRARSGLTQATGSQFDVLGLLSYEVDLWGRLRRLSDAARAELLSAEETRRALQLSLVSQVASTYFQLHALDAQLDVAQRTLESRSASLELTRIMFDDGEGIVSELDVRQAETQVHAARSSIAGLHRALALTENALSQLLGNPPGSIPRGIALAQQPVPETPPPGLPSELLLRRPDVRAAEQALAAAHANIAAARAAYFPTLSLTAALGLQSTDLDDLFAPGLSRTWRFAPQVAGPIFNAGRIRAGVAATRAREKAALASYSQAIQNAFREVDDALASVAYLRDQLEADVAAAAAERARLELSRLRYQGGVDDYSDVLDAERFLFNAELQAIQTRSDLLTGLAQLYKALGGGWNPPPATGTELPFPSPSSTPPSP
jgi:multidrug efflux system outer membrane protein